MRSFISNEEKKHILNSLRSSVPATKFLILKKLGEVSDEDPEKLKGLASSDEHTFADMINIISYMIKNDLDESIRREATITLEKIRSILEPRSVLPVYCTSCENLIDLGWDHCASCGKEISEENFEVSRCNSCRGFIKEIWAFCTHCKAPLQKKLADLRCPNCKRKMEKTWFSCPYCGVKMKNA